MRLLLDTHAWHWAAIEDPRLSKRARDLIDDMGNELYLSAISPWELRVHVRKGRVRMEGPVDDWIRGAIRAMGIVVLPIGLDIALRSESLEAFPRADPSDRFIVATALEHGLRLISVDEPIRAWGQVPTDW